MRKHRLLGGLAAALAILVAACGGGGGGADGGIGGTGVALGTITGFGSVFVNGVEFSSDRAVIKLDDRTVAQSDLRVGMVAQVDRDQIHRYTSDQLRAPTTEQHRRACTRAAWIAIAVADRGHADVHVLRRLPACCITYAFALVHAVDRDQTGGECHRRMQTEVDAVAAFDHAHAIQRTTRAQPVAMRGRPAQDRRRIGQ